LHQSYHGNFDEKAMGRTLRLETIINVTYCSKNKIKANKKKFKNIKVGD
jgi:hypothetical protein